MMFCTHAITGSAYPAYQPIYICETCHPPTQSSSSSEIPLPKCICQCCAMTCHVEHIVTYVGVGPCTCDCRGNDDDEEEMAVMENRHSCLLAETSKREACKLLLGATSNNGVMLNSPMAKETSLNDEYPLQCIPCGIPRAHKSSPLRRSYMDGYICDSFTLSHLATPSRKKEGEDDNDGPPTQLCENLIQQAIELANLSKETFWIPDNIDDDDDNNNVEYCELELLARKIYRHHISLYSLSSQSSLLSSGVEGGAEWWVQVKHPTTNCKSTVDLHYDKDEVLAETFGLGSFPTLSTVTYLTDSLDNVPTIIFPHTYHDEEERTIGSMALSIPKLGKHVVFDGRLLHGAPYHSSLLRPSTTTVTTNRQQQRQCDDNKIVSEGGVNNNNHNDDNYSSSSSSLRVTFLVNIWTCRKPSNVHVLPASIRNMISNSHSSTTTTANDNANNMSSLRRVIPSLTFEPRFIHKITIPVSPLSSFSWANNNIQSAKTKMLDKIILPFVSKGATWIDDGCENVDVEEVDDISMDNREELTTTDVKTRVEEEKGGNDENMQDGDDYDTDNEEDEEDDEDDDLFLVLSPLFATDAYMSDNTADTFIFKFDGNDNGARLVRGGELREIGYNTHLNNDGDGHKNDVIAHEFVSKLRKQVPSFVSSIIMNLNSQYGMDVTNYQADHVCYRTATVYEYKRLVEALQADINNICLLVESEIGGRSIATFKLAMPIEISNPCITTGDGGGGDSSSSTRRIDVIEIPSPKDGSPYISGLEHVEFVIGNNRLLHNNNYSPVNDNHHQSTLKAWMESFPSVSWNIKALKKYCNPDVSMTLNLPGGKVVSVKFHLLPLEDVIKFEETM